jgi:hypothetical protein
VAANSADALTAIGATATVVSGSALLTAAGRHGAIDMIAVSGCILAAACAIRATSNFAAVAHRRALVATATRPCGALICASLRPIALSATACLFSPVISITLILTGVRIISRRLYEALIVRLCLRG